MNITQTAPCLGLLKKNPEIPSNHSNRIHRIAYRALAELAMALAMTAICIPFVPCWAVSLQMITVCLAIPALNTAIHLLGGDARSKKETFFAETACSSTFYHLGAIHTIALIHETGHFFIARLLFKGQPQIQIIPFGGGWTKWSARNLTSLGLRLGFHRSIFLITLAGTALALIAASVMLIAGLILRQTHPDASPYLMGMGIYPFLHHARYALSALWTPPSQLGHDFVRLKTFGVPPLAAAAAILLIPAVILGTVKH